MLPLCRSQFTGVSWQFISLSLSLSSGGPYRTHLPFSSRALNSLSNSKSSSRFSLFFLFFFYTQCSCLSHSSHTRSFLVPPPLRSLFFSTAVIFHLSAHTGSPSSACLHQFLPPFLFSSRPVSLSLSPLWMLLLPSSFILLLPLLILPSLLPQGVGSLWLVLSGLWISVLPLEIYSV